MVSVAVVLNNSRSRNILKYSMCLHILSSASINSCSRDRFVKIHSIMRRLHIEYLINSSNYLKRWSGLKYFVPFTQMFICIFISCWKLEMIGRHITIYDNEKPSNGFCTLNRNRLLYGILFEIISLYVFCLFCFLELYDYSFNLPCLPTAIATRAICASMAFSFSIRNKVENKVEIEATR